MNSKVCNNAIINNCTYLKDNIAVDNGVITNFRIHETQKLNLCLIKNTTLTQMNGPVTLKTDDSLRICGHNNLIIIKDKFTIAGQLIFEENSELIFEFDDASNNPEIYFTSDQFNFLELPATTHLTFRGNGNIWLNDGFKIKFLGKSPTLQPTLTLNNAATLQLLNTGKTFIGGKGKIVIDNRSQFYVWAGQHLIIGDKNDDEISILIDRASIFSVNGLKTVTGLASNAPAKVSFKNATYNINLKQKGILYIGKNGVMEFNSVDNIPHPGWLETLLIDQYGYFFIDTDGTVILNKNSLDVFGEKLTNITPPNGTLSGNGILQYANTKFAGQIQKNATMSAMVNTVTFVKNNINIVPTLPSATLFIDKSNRKKLKTKCNIIVDLKDDDVIKNEDGISGMVYGSNKGKLFIIHPNGRRE